MIALHLTSGGRMSKDMQSAFEHACGANVHLSDLAFTPFGDNTAHLIVVALVHRYWALPLLGLIKYWLLSKYWVLSKY